MIRHMFKPYIRPVAQVTSIRSTEAFQEERGMFSCHPDFALHNGGPILREILLSFNWKAPEYQMGLSVGLVPIVDYRVHRLMPGMYPAIPGWHCDAFHRDSYDGQPRLDMPEPYMAHWTCIVSSRADVSRTEFVIDPVEIMPDYESDLPIWKQLHEHIEASHYRTTRTLEGVLYRFNQDAIHRAAPCVNRGHRSFFRLSLMRSRPRNIITSQQQVYLVDHAGGW